MRMITLLAAVALTGCASSPALNVPVSPAAAPTLTPPYARDRCGEDITPTHPATPDNVTCP